MTLVIIFGPPAVGKMTVGLELQRLTGFGLFHNHMTVDPVIRLFPFDSDPYRRLVSEFRRRIFEEYAASGSSGLIFTFVWVLDDPEDRAFVDRTAELFTSLGGTVCFVEIGGDTVRASAPQCHTFAHGGEVAAAQCRRLACISSRCRPEVSNELARLVLLSGASLEDREHGPGAGRGRPSDSRALFIGARD